MPETVIETAAGYTLTIRDDDDGNRSYSMIDRTGRELQFVAGIFYDRANHVCYRANDGELCRVIATKDGKQPGHVWEFEDARLNVDYRSGSELVKKTELLDPTGFLTKNSCNYLTSWLETHFPALDYFVAPSQFAQAGSFTRYPQNQLYVLIVGKDNGNVRVKRENAGLLVSNSFLRYSDPIAVKQFFEYVLSEDGWETSLSDVEAKVLRGPAAAPFNAPPVQAVAAPKPVPAPAPAPVDAADVPIVPVSGSTIETGRHPSGKAGKHKK